MSNFLIKNVMIVSLLCLNALGLKRAICASITVVWPMSYSGVAPGSFSEMDLKTMNRKPLVSEPQPWQFSGSPQVQIVLCALAFVFRGVHLSQLPRDRIKKHTCQVPLGLISFHHGCECMHANLH